MASTPAAEEPVPSGVATFSVVIVIPALDEERSLPLVLRDLPRDGPGFRVAAVVVVDNGSRDRSAVVAREAGALVVEERRRGYGSACLAGIARAHELAPDAIVFMDADWSDLAGDLPAIVGPIARGSHDFVLGSRLAGRADPGALPPHVRFGNRLASLLILLATGQRYSDLGPFRAIRPDCLERIGMRDTNYGWTVEMQVKAARAGLRILEVPVGYRRRIGVSKISGTVKGTILAGGKIIYSVARYRFFP